MHAAIKLRSNRPVAAPTILRTAVPSSAIRGNIERESWGPRVDYQAILGDTRKAEMGQIVAYLREELPYFWREEYVLMTPRKTNIVLMEHGTFTYQYDFYSQLEVFGIVHANGHIEDRLVAGLGMSAPAALRREAARMRGWIGPTEEFLGPDRDKGHIFARSFGGLVDGLEINLFSQARSLNRGWSLQGKMYRKMEQYCATYSDTFCFSRPLYSDETSKPTTLEFGILLPTKELWVEQFQN